MQDDNHHHIAYLVPGGPPLHALMRHALLPGFTLLTPNTSDPDAVRAALTDADFVITVKMNAEVMSWAPKLRLIQLAGVGFDGVDLGAARARNIPVAQTVAGTIPGVAEHAVMMALCVLKQARTADASVRAGEWLVWQLRPRSQSLYGRKVGVVGFGRIGRETAKRFRAFDTEVAFYDPFPPPVEVSAALGVRPMALFELLAWADVVTLHLPLNPDTRSLFGREAFAAMKANAILINTARGELVDEPALIEALREGRLAGAGLDVFAQEPPAKDNPLFTMDNVVLSPHCATGTRDSVMEKTRAACENMQRVLRGEAPLNVIG